MLQEVRSVAGCYGLAAAGKKSTTRLPLPPLGCGGEWKETGKKPVGQDKGSLTEQQTKGTVTTTIQIRGIHKTNPQNRATLPNRHRCALPSCGCVPAAPLPPTGTQHDGTWYGTPCLGKQSPPYCAPSWILVKINLVLAKPSTPVSWYGVF